MKHGSMRLSLEMRHTLVLSLACLAGAATLAAQVPVMHLVVPESGNVGSVLKVEGVSLGKTQVDEVYLSDHTFDMKVKVLNQTNDSIEFRIPPFAKPGRLQLVVKTVGKEPLIMEQPVYVTIEEPKVAEAKDAKDAKDADTKDAKDTKDPKEDKREATLQANATAPPPANGTK